MRFFKGLFNIISNIRRHFAVLYFEYYVKIASVVRGRKNLIAKDMYNEWYNERYNLKNTYNHDDVEDAGWILGMIAVFLLAYPLVKFLLLFL